MATVNKKKKRKRGHKAWTVQKKRQKVDEKPAWESYLEKIYFDPKHPASFQGVQKLHLAVKEEGKFEIGINRLKQWLQNNEPYSLNRSVQRNFKRSRVIVKGVDDQHDADLADFQKLSKRNNGINWLLVVIDIFSRYAWVEPIKDKTEKKVVQAFEKIYGSTLARAQPRKPRALRTDAGKEFMGNYSEAFFDKMNIVHFKTLNEVKANYAERFIKTLKTKIWRYIAQKNTYRYIDVLQDLVNSYNHTVHSSIKMKPADVNHAMEKGLWWSQYKPKETFAKEKLEKKLKFTYKKGDYVRIPHTRSTFQREYDQKWTGEIFIVDSAFVRDKLKTYTIVDQENHPVFGTFYESELQKVNPNNNQLWKIDHIVEEKKVGQVKYSKVKWKYWGKQFNTWIKTSAVKEYTP